MDITCFEIVTSLWFGKKACGRLCGADRDPESASPLEGFKVSGTFGCQDCSLSIAPPRLLWNRLQTPRPPWQVDDVRELG